MMDAKQRIVHRRWVSVNQKRAIMEEFILKLMANPDATAEDLSKAHAMYAHVCTELSGISTRVDNLLRTGSTGGAVVALAPVVHEKCSCGYEGKRIEGEPYRCPQCGDPPIQLGI